MEFNENVRILRKQAGLTQEELAEALFVSRTAILKWASGSGVDLNFVFCSLDRSAMVLFCLFLLHLTGVLTYLRIINTVSVISFIEMGML